MTQFTMFYPAVLSLEDELKKRRQYAHDFMVPSTRILLAFSYTDAHLNNFFLKIPDTKAIYMELKAISQRYAASNSRDDFKEN